MAASANSSAKSKTKTKRGRRLNRKSYLLNMALALPLLIFARQVGVAVPQNDAEAGFQFLGIIVSLIIALFIIIWTIQRLHDLNKSGWFALLLIPPVTIFLLIYTLFFPGDEAANKWGKPEKDKLYFFSVRIKSLLGVIGIAVAFAFAVFLVLCFWLSLTSSYY